MFQSSQSNIVTPEYSEFIEEFNKFLKHYSQASQLYVVFKTLKGRNTQITSLYAQAIEAHIAAIYAHFNLVALYTSFADKMLEQCPRAKL